MVTKKCEKPLHVNNHTLSYGFLGTEPTIVSPPRLRACRRLTLDHGKAQTKYQILANKSVLRTKPEQMLTKRGEFNISSIW
jgi:hypothetical protein